MKKKSQAALSLLLPAIGAGLIYVGYQNYVTVSADDPYVQKNSTLLTTLIISGLVLLALGIFVAYRMIKGRKSSN